MLTQGIIVTRCLHFLDPINAECRNIKLPSGQARKYKPVSSALKMLSGEYSFKMSGNDSKKLSAIIEEKKKKRRRRRKKGEKRRRRKGRRRRKKGVYHVPSKSKTLPVTALLDHQKSPERRGRRKPVRWHRH